jgi:hypothetical protein
MASLLQDIKTQSDWITKAFAADKLDLDYTIHSFVQIDEFFDKHSKDGRAVKNGRLSKNIGPILFSLGSYVGETIIKNVPGSIWQTDDNDPQGEITASVKLPDGSIVFPMQRMMKRFQNGLEDAVYVYGHHITKNYIDEPFDQSFWSIGKKEHEQIKKAWWKFWG